MKPIHSLSREILPFFLGKVFISASVHMFMALYLTEVTANPQQATTSLPKLNNLILSIKVMCQICYIFTWTLLKSEAPITGPEQKRLFHRHSHTQLTVWLCVCVCVLESLCAIQGSTWMDVCTELSIMFMRGCSCICVSV